MIAGNLTLNKAQALDTACTGATGATVYTPARKQLADRFYFSQKFAQVDPWTERAEGVDAHEYVPLKRVG